MTRQELKRKELKDSEVYMRWYCGFENGYTAARDSWRFKHDGDYKPVVQSMPEYTWDYNYRDGYDLGWQSFNKTLSVKRNN